MPDLNLPGSRPIEDTQISSNNSWLASHNKHTLKSNKTLEPNKDSWKWKEKWSKLHELFSEYQQFSSHFGVWEKLLRDEKIPPPTSQKRLQDTERIYVLIKVHYSKGQSNYAHLHISKRSSEYIKPNVTGINHLQKLWIQFYTLKNGKNSQRISKRLED